MTVLLDTQILVHRESDLPLPRMVSDLFTIFYALRTELVIHPLSLSADELKQYKKIDENNCLMPKLSLYPKIEFPPIPFGDKEFAKLIAEPATQKENFDNNLLYCVYKKTVDYLVSEDKDIHNKANLLDVSKQVLDLKDALLIFRAQLEQRAASVGRLSSATPRLSFFKNGKKWMVGDMGMEKSYPDEKGFEFIYKLLQKNKDDKSPAVMESGTYYHKKTSTASHRTSAKKAINRALKKLNGDLNPARIFLNDKTIETGKSCSYTPDISSPFPHWKLEK